MVRLIVVGEGQTEEAFVNHVLAETLATNEVYVEPRIIPTSPNSRGGALNFDRVKQFLRNTLLQSNDAFVTTFFDLYALDPSFRGVAQTKGLSPFERAGAIEQALHEDIVEFVGCRPERFLPHIQPHEFEALLFSDVARLCEVEPDWAAHVEDLAGIRQSVENPEWINDSPQTAPSKRLDVLKPRYRKTRHGPAAAAKIGLDKIREACPHFGQWFERMVSLRPL